MTTKAWGSTAGEALLVRRPFARRLREQRGDSRRPDGSNALGGLGPRTALRYFALDKYFLQVRSKNVNYVILTALTFCCCHTSPRAAPSLATQHMTPQPLPNPATAIPSDEQFKF